MKQKLLTIILILGMSIIPQMTYAQVDFNKKPTDDLGDVEDKFQESFFEALKQQGIENYQRAIDALLVCEKLDNTKTVVYYELGKNYIALKNYGAAEDVLKKAVSREPENEWFLDQLYEVYNLQGDTSKAIKTVKQLVKYHPDYRQDLAELYIKTKDYNDAIKILDQLDAEFGINPDRDMLRNEIYTITGRDDDRIENLEERVKSDPEKEDAYLRLIYRYSETGDSDKAFETARALLKKHPESKLVHLALYKFYLDGNDAKNAINSMKIALSATEIKPEAKAMVFNDFVNFVSKHPEYEKELLEMTTLVGSDKSVKTLTELAQYHLKIEDKPKALQYFEEALQQDPNNFAIIKDALLLQLDLNMDDAAANKSQEAIELFPAQPILYLINGVANIKLNKPKKAISSLEAGMDYIIDDAKIQGDFYTQLSVAHKLANNISKSEAFAKKAEAIIKQQQ